MAKGISVAVGQQWAIYGNVKAKKAAPGCCLLATANKNQVQVAADFRADGHAVLVTDQEGLAFTDEGFLDNIDGTILSDCDLFLAQNDLHRSILLKRYPAARVVTAGNPRIDLLHTARHPPPLAEPYLLFNTSLALVNSVWGTEETASERLLSGAGITRQEVAERIRVERACQRELETLLKWTIDTTALRIVIRPHPAENTRMWEDFATGSPKVTVVAGSDPTPWIQHARIMVHCDSTTGIEASILGTPCINLAPIPSWSERFIMRDVNTTVPSIASARQLIEALLAGDHWPDRRQNVSTFFPQGGGKATAQYIATALEGANPLAPFGWHRAERTNEQRAKFSVSPEEFQQRAARVFAGAGLTFAKGLGLSILDDSLFLICPGDQPPVFQ
jgi:surface carbohydrate biosynthesis protein